jgi:hypothetical protein
VVNGRGPQGTLYRRAHWQMPEGERIIADLNPRIFGGYDPIRIVFAPALRFCGRATWQRRCLVPQQVRSFLMSR